jgi:N-acetylglucosamine-6-phosphate deacetylase
VFRRCIDAVRNYRNSGGQGVHGLHLEGPWLNPQKRGAHIEAYIHPPSIDEVKELLDYGKDVVTMITIAPEICSAEVMEEVLSRGIILSAGHSNATYPQAMEGFDRGIAAVTHLFNAMSPLHHREPGLPGAALHHPKIRASIIPDGHHVDFAVVSLAHRLMGDRLFAITDAVTATEEGPYRHRPEGDKYECNGTLSGSALSMHEAFTRLVKNAGLSLEAALGMCSTGPAEVLGCAHYYGKIAPGYTGQFVMMDKDLKLVTGSNN